MIYPKNFEHKLGFTKIRAMLSSYCLSPATHTEVENMQFSTRKNAILRSLNFTEEMKKMVLFKDDFPMSEFPDLKGCFHRLKEETSVLTESDFKNLNSFLENFQHTQKYIKKLNEKEFREMKTLYDKTEFPLWVKDRIRQVFTNRGEIKASASKTLQSLTLSLGEIEQKIRRNMEQIMNQAIANGWANSDTSVAIIDGQRAIPIDSTHKRKIQGYIIGESASGKTVYLVPEAFSRMSNEIRNIEMAIHTEKQKILAELTDDIRDYKDSLETCFHCHIDLDFHRSKAKLAQNLEAIAPAIIDENTIKYHKARHPLLFLNFKQQNREVVPFTLEINNKSRFYVISGPNAGGKSVSLQTVGLLQYMLQCGLQIPVGGNTECSLLNNIFIDFGDDQSIENDLSTYSSHLKNMKQMLEHADNQTLILIDEFGGGTDPEMGSAIAEAMLQNLIDKGACGIVTTHYTNLKHFAGNYPGAENAAMMINNQTMEPLFQLQTGIPGSSYSFEIARRSGIPNDIIELARSKVGKEQYSFDKHLKQVIKDKRYWENKRKEINQERKRLDAELNRYSVAYESFRRKEKEILDEAKEKSLKMISDANKEIENTIRKIKESQADKEKTKEARKKLEAQQKKINQTNISNPKKSAELKNFQNTIKEAVPKKKPQIKAPDKHEIVRGSTVFIKHLNQHGEVIDIGEKSYVIRLGNLMTTLKKDKVELSQKQQNNQRKSSSNSHYYDKILNFKDRIDLRGKRADEALNELIEFIDNAIINGVKEVKILHGKGYGILRQIIRDYLSKQQEIQSFHDEDIRFGGDGITVVKFRV